MAPATAETVPVLRDRVVTLRPLSEADLPAVVEQSRDPETARWTTVPSPYGPEQAEAFLALTRDQWAGGERCTWVVEHEGRFCGLVAVRARGDRVVEVSFAAHPAARGRGLTSRALALVVRDAVERGAELVLWHALVGNFGSRRVAWRTGFRISDPVRRMRAGKAVESWSGSLVKGELLQPRHPWPVPAPLEGDGLRLRPFRDDDVEAMPDRVDDLGVRFMPSAMPRRADFADWLLERRTLTAQGESLVWAITDPDDAVRGAVELFRLGAGHSPGSGMLGYWLLEGARGAGLLGRALDTLVAHVFAHEVGGGLGLRRLGASCAADNLASARVLRRAGFALAGSERAAHDVDEVPGDVLKFNLLASDDRQAQRVEPASTPVIETERLRLRPWRDTDVPGPGEGADDASLAFMPEGAHPDAARFPAWLRRKRGFMERGEAVHWCVADRASDHAHGLLSVFGMGPAAGRFQGEVGYWLHPPARGRGILAEALPPVIDHAFAPMTEGGLGLTRLHAETDIDNAASQRLLEGAGFRRWGEDRSAFRRVDGTLTDGAHFELLASDERLDRRTTRAPLAEVTLDGERVRLRPWVGEDAPRVVEACRDERTRLWLGRLPHAYTLVDAAAYLLHCHVHAAHGTGLFLAAADPADDRCLGSVAVMELGGDDPTTGEIGYWAHPDGRGRGVMSEAVGRVVRHAFAPQEDGGLGLRRLVLRAAVGNDASHRVATTNGFLRTGVARRAERLGDGSFVDLVDYDLLEQEWSAG